MPSRLLHGYRKAGLSGLFRVCGFGIIAWLSAISVVTAEPLSLEVVNARFTQERGQSLVTLTLSPSGKATLAKFTAANVGRTVEIRAGGRAVMKARLVEPITGGVIQISGSLADTDARQLANNLSSGKGTIEIEALAD